MKPIIKLLERHSSSALALLGAGFLFAPAAFAGGIVASIDKAPVVADGDVSGMPTDYVITLDGSLDPTVPGRSLAAGDVIKVIFPPDFDLGNLHPDFPLLDAPTPLPPVTPLSDNDCVPAFLTCTTAVILRGWPQDPYFPPALFHTLSIDVAENALIFTALQDLGASPPVNPGIKQLHLILNGVTNPAPGSYRISVEAQTGPGGAWETGSGMLRVIPRTRPSVNITSVFVKATSGQLGAPACGPGTNPPNPDNPIFQTTTTGAFAPHPWTFLLWGRNNEPLTGVSLTWVNSDHALLRRNARTIGHLYIDAPKGATGYGIVFNPLSCGTLLPGAPVIAGTPGIGPQAVGRMDMVFHAGDVPGDYRTTITLNNGNSVHMTVSVE
jgi:hypothetical protein